MNAKGFFVRRMAQLLFGLALLASAAPALAACGGEGEQLCSLFTDGRMGCNRGLADVLGKCQRPGLCGADGQRLCYVFIDGRGGCNTDLSDDGRSMCTHPACGRLGERACAIVGRLSCDANLVEINNSCFARGACGAAGQRACLAGERTGTSCDANLVERAGMCVATPHCGGVNQDACAISGRSTCNVGLVELNNTCYVRGACGSAGDRSCLLGERSGTSCDANLVEVDFKCYPRGSCGAAGQRACLVGERAGPNCDAGLSELGGQCIVCGGLGQRACALLGRISCNAGLVEVNDMCFTRTECGMAGERACLIGERRDKSCNAGLIERAGRCHPCGGVGQSACAIAGRLSCDAGLVEVKDMCFARAECGGASQRACLIGERRTPGCDAGLREREGMCFDAMAGSTAGPAFQVYIRTDPPLPFLLAAGTPVTLMANVLERTTKLPVIASRIELMQAPYSGPASIAPRLVKTCQGTDQCSIPIAALRRNNAPAISYMAKVTVGSDTVVTPIRLADLKFAGAPVRLDVSAELVGRGKITQVSEKRTIDLVFYAGTGYELSTPGNAKVFSDRLRDEHVSMLRAAKGLVQPSTLAENLEAVSFHVSLSGATVKHNNASSMCEHSTSNPVPWGDAQGILHPNLKCRDWSVPGPFYSAALPHVSWHEMHHAAFGLSDEYCAGTVHSQRGLFPNVYNSQADCARLGSNPATCAPIVDPAGCTGAGCECSTSYWRSDSRSDDVMISDGPEGADDRRAARAKFAGCKAGRC